MPSRIGAERFDKMDIVRFSVPGTLSYRDVVLRVVASACRLGRSGAGGAQEPGHQARAEDFDDKVVSAVGEAFNNIALHAYAGVCGEAKLELGFEPDGLTVRLLDTGESFNPSAELGQNLETLRESRMGLEIILSCMDEVTYVPGGPTTPNVLTMTKRYFASANASDRGARMTPVRA
ncbi:MAG TPA: ATP-binding protein [Polyangiaceae bacterium]|nr:ATP-binding protein [Polyangiaceae bacterium]